MRLSVNADEVRATPPEPIARAVNPFFHQRYHPPTLGSPRKYEAAASSTFIIHTGYYLHSPLAAATDYLLQAQEVRRAISDPANQVHGINGHGDTENPRMVPFGERDLSHVSFPIQSFARVCPFAVFPNHFLQSSHDGMRLLGSQESSISPSLKAE